MMKDRSFTRLDLATETHDRPLFMVKDGGPAGGMAFCNAGRLKVGRAVENGDRSQMACYEVAFI